MSTLEPGEYEDDFKWKNFVLQSCRSRRKLQFSYKVYLHPSSNKKVTNFWKQIVPLPPWATAVAVARVHQRAVL
jgi:hypothetical protein